jgi:hypothetical protein
MTILVGSGPMQEVRELVGFGSLIVDRPLEHDHPVGTLILGRSKTETMHTNVNSDQENVAADTTATAVAFVEPIATEDARDIKAEGKTEVSVSDYAPAMDNEAPDTLSSLDSDSMKSKSRKAVMFVEEGLLESKDARESGDVYYRSQSR